MNYTIWYLTVVIVLDLGEFSSQHNLSFLVCLENSNYVQSDGTKEPGSATFLSSN